LPRIGMGRAMNMTILAFGAYGFYGRGLDIEMENKNLLPGLRFLVCARDYRLDQ